MQDLIFKRDHETLPRPSLVICDVDRTLLTHDHRLLPNVIDAARRLKEAGVPLVLASTRSPTGLARVHDQVGAADIVICFNGAWAGSFSTRDTLTESLIPRDLALDAMEFVHAHAGSPIWFQLDRCVAVRSDEMVVRRRTDETGDVLSLVNNSSGYADLLHFSHRVLDTLSTTHHVSPVLLIFARHGFRQHPASLF